MNKIKEQLPRFIRKLGKKYGFKKTNWKNKIRLQKQNETTDFLIKKWKELI